MVGWSRWISTEKTTYKSKSNIYHHPIITPPHSYQADLMYYSALESINNGYEAIINFVEIISKKAYAYPLQGKTSSEVFDAFTTFMKEK